MLGGRADRAAPSHSRRAPPRSPLRGRSLPGVVIAPAPPCGPRTQDATVSASSHPTTGELRESLPRDPGAAPMVPKPASTEAPFLRPRNPCRARALPGDGARRARRRRRRDGRIAAAGPAVGGPGPRGAAPAGRRSSCPGWWTFTPIPPAASPGTASIPTSTSCPSARRPCSRRARPGALNLGALPGDVVIEPLADAGPARRQHRPARRGDARRELRDRGGRRRGGLRRGGAGEPEAGRRGDLGDRRST